MNNPKAKRVSSKLSHKQVVCEDTNSGRALIRVPIERNQGWHFEMHTLGTLLTSNALIFVQTIL